MRQETKTSQNFRRNKRHDQLYFTMFLKSHTVCKMMMHVRKEITGFDLSMISTSPVDLISRTLDESRRSFKVG